MSDCTSNLCMATKVRDGRQCKTPKEDPGTISWQILYLIKQLGRVHGTVLGQRSWGHIILAQAGQGVILVIPPRLRRAYYMPVSDKVTVVMSGSHQGGKGPIQATASRDMEFAQPGSQWACTRPGNPHH